MGPGTAVEGKGNRVTPQAAVAFLADAVAAGGEFAEEDLYAAMARAGLPDDVADHAYKFTQIAWGRVFLEGLGPKLPTEYFWFDAAGSRVELRPARGEPLLRRRDCPRRPPRPPARLRAVRNDVRERQLGEHGAARRVKAGKPGAGSGVHFPRAADARRHDEGPGIREALHQGGGRSRAVQPPVESASGPEAGSPATEAPVAPKATPAPASSKGRGGGSGNDVSR